MKIFFYGLALFATCYCHADLTPYFKKDSGKKIEKSPIKNIDFIYLINLDQSPQKLEKTLAELKPYKINPHRFSAVYAWDLSIEELNAIGVKFLPGMQVGNWAVSFSPEGHGAPEYTFLREDSYERTFFSRSMTLGSIGNSLSHLSVLQDAYDSGYQTIWILDDNVIVKKDPRKLATFIKKLDALVGKDGWDILYTDTDVADAALYEVQQDFEKDLTADLSFLSRPDMDLSDRSPFAKRAVLSEDFIKVGSRIGSHSMIIRRSGIKKILDFEKQNHIFIPYGHEIALVPGIRLFSLRSDLVTHEPVLSDTMVSNNDEVASQVPTSSSNAQETTTGLDPKDMFAALYQFALSQQQSNPDAALETFLKAYAMRPTRAEPLFQCAKIYREKGNVLVGYLMAKHALTHSYPADDFNIEHAVYDHALLIEFANCALLLGKFDEGFEACAKLLANHNLPEEYRSRIQSNYELARARLGLSQSSWNPATD